MSVRAQRILARAAAGGRARARHAGRERFTPSPIACCACTRVDVGLDPAFTVLDRSDAADSIDVVRNDLGLAKTRAALSQEVDLPRHLLARRQRAGAAREERSRVVSLVQGARGRSAKAVRRLRRAQAATARARLRRPPALLAAPHGGRERWRRASAVASITCSSTSTRTPTRCRRRSSCGCDPTAHGVTVVGDDAQSIYAFRAATVRNILDFPQQFSPPARVVTLEQNYRSTQPILDAANAVIAFASERFTKNLLLDPAFRRATAARERRRRGRAGRLRRDAGARKRARPACRSSGRRCCFARRTTPTRSRSSCRVATFPSSSTAASSSSKRRTSRTRCACCAGARTCATVSRPSACCSSCPASVPAARSAQRTHSRSGHFRSTRSRATRRRQRHAPIGHRCASCWRGCAGTRPGCRSSGSSAAGISRTSSASTITRKSARRISISSSRSPRTIRRANASCRS